MIYAVGYMTDLGKRSMSFLVQFAASPALLFGALGRIVYSLMITASQWSSVSTAQTGLGHIG